ncbi:MAG: TolC family protein [Myxococcota bacterium]
MEIPVHRRAIWLGLPLALLLAVAPVRAEGAEPLTLSRALERARTQNPEAEVARQRLAEAQAELRGARVWFVENPEIEAVGLPGPGAPLEVEARQALGGPGERGARVRRARELLAAGEAERDDAFRLIDLAVAEAFFEALAAEESAATAAEAADLAKDLADIARVRVERGADSVLVSNTARIRLAEAERSRIDAETHREAARLELGRLLGGGPADPADAWPSVNAPPGVDDAISKALESRPELAALRHATEAERARAREAASDAWPEVTVGAAWRRENDVDQWLGVAGLTVPIFNRNQGEIGSARAAATRLEAELAARLVAVEAEVRTAWQARDAAERGLAVYDADVLRAQEESVALLRRAFEEGKVDLSELVLLQRELLEGRLGFVEARLALALEDARLRVALGLPINVDGGER